MVRAPPTQRRRARLKTNLTSSSSALALQSFATSPAFSSSVLANVHSQDTPILNARIQALPQELQDEIFEHTLETPTTVMINKTYKPPVALQLNHGLRVKFAKKYYGTVEFEDPLANERLRVGESGLRVMITWLAAIGHEQRSMLRKICAEVRTPTTDFKGACRTMACASWNSIWLHDDGGLDLLHVRSGSFSMKGVLEHVGCYVGAADARTYAGWEALGRSKGMATLY